jgi:hypothetical protein
MDYRPAPASPTPPYVAPYKLLNFFIEENAGVIGELLVIDTSNGAVVCTFSTIAAGLYDIAITGGNSVFGLMVSSCQKTGSLSPCIVSIEQTGSTNLSLFVQDHVTGNYVSNWLRLNLTIYVKTT